MAEVNGVGANTYAKGSNAVKNYKNSTVDADGVEHMGKSSLGMDDFMKLLAAQLKYQDMNNPMDNSEMMAQMTQMATVQSMDQFSQINLTTYATSMMGKEVTMAAVNDMGFSTGDTITGTITGVALYGTEPILYIDKKPYAMSQIMTVGDAPVPKTDKDNDKTDGDGSGGDSSGGDGASGGDDPKTEGV